MLRIIVIISIGIIGFFFYRQCSTDELNINRGQNTLSYESAYDDALARNSIISPRSHVNFSVEEMFGSRSHIYLNNREQIQVKEHLQKNFEAYILGNKELFSLERNDSQIEKKLEQERRVQTISLRTNQSSGVSASGGSGRCAGLIFDPCIVVGEDIPPPGIMEFGIWRYDLPI